MNRIVQHFVIMAVLFSASMCFAQQDTPSSERSRGAINRVKPELERELSDKGLKFGDPIFARIFKEEEELEMWIQKGASFQLFKIYRICSYGSKGLGPKTKEGDGRAPEGFYFVPPRNLNPISRFHLAFNLGYPNSYDMYHGRTGYALMVHGRCVSDGCYAMTDSAIEEIYALADGALKNGQRFFRVHVFPFRITDENMKKHEGSQWLEFWTNLKEGYDFFENNNSTPPNIEVRGGRYVFEKP